MQILLVVGRKKRGKTMLVEKLVLEFKKRGYRVGSIKHTDSDHEFDTPGKNSYRHTKAGASTTLVLSPQKVALFSSELRKQKTDKLFKLFFKGLDLIIGEGFRESSYSKVEVMDSSKDRAPLCKVADNLVAIICDRKIDSPVPVFLFHQMELLADFLEKRVIRRKRKNFPALKRK